MTFRKEKMFVRWFSWLIVVVFFANLYIVISDFVLMIMLGGNWFQTQQTLKIMEDLGV